MASCGVYARQPVMQMMKWNANVNGGIKMGWATGSEIAEEVWKVVKDAVPSQNRQYVADKLLEIFENHDADAFDSDMEIVKDAGRNFDEE